MQKEDWIKLSCIDNKNLRSKLTDEIVIDALQEQMGLMSNTVETMRLIFLSAGLKLTDGYIEMSKKYAFTKDETLINPRIRLDSEFFLGKNRSTCSSPECNRKIRFYSKL